MVHHTETFSEDTNILPAGRYLCLWGSQYQHRHLVGIVLVFNEHIQLIHIGTIHINECIVCTARLAIVHILCSDFFDMRLKIDKESFWLTFISYENKAKHKQLYSDRDIDEGGSIVALMAYHMIIS